MVPTVEWKDGAVRLLDQSRLFEQQRVLRRLRGELREVRAGRGALALTRAVSGDLRV